MSKIVIILALVSFGNKLISQPQAILRKGDLAQNFIEVDSDGNEVNLESYRGKIVLINFTATFCSPCWKTYNQMDGLQKKYSNDLKIISIHMDEDKERWKKIAKKNDIEFGVSSIWESSQKEQIFQLYDATGFPYFVLIDHNGIVSKKWFGNYENRLKRNLKKLIRRMGTDTRTSSD
ncbi:MAG: TlpA disulfide reductase family protein [Bacteroidota bacterium]